MRFTLATFIVALAVLTVATPQPVGQSVGMAIPITKRLGLTNADKSVNIEALKSHVASTNAYVVFFACSASIQISRIARSFVV